MSSLVVTSTPTRGSRRWRVAVGACLIGSPVLIAVTYVVQQFAWPCSGGLPSLVSSLPSAAYVLALLAGAGAVVVSVVGGRLDRVSAGGAIGGALVGLVLIALALVFLTGSTSGGNCPVDLPVAYVP